MKLRTRHEKEYATSDWDCTRTGFICLQRSRQHRRRRPRCCRHPLLHHRSLRCRHPPHPPHRRPLSALSSYPDPGPPMPGRQRGVCNSPPTASRSYCPSSRARLPALSMPRSARAGPWLKAPAAVAAPLPAARQSPTSLTGREPASCTGSPFCRGREVAP